MQCRFTTLRFATLAAGLIGLLASNQPCQAQTYRVDNAHSSLLFRVKHLEATNFWGRFNGYSGTITVGEGGGSVELAVKTDSIDTANQARDQHLKSPDFFNARQFPEITFKSSSVKQLETDKYEAEGTLTLHGVAKPLKVVLVRTGTGRNQRGAPVAGFETTFDFNRSDFGMTYGIPGVSDNVRILACLECGQQ